MSKRRHGHRRGYQPHFEQLEPRCMFSMQAALAEVFAGGPVVITMPERGPVAPPALERPYFPESDPATDPPPTTSAQQDTARFALASVELFALASNRSQTTVDGADAVLDDPVSLATVAARVSLNRQAAAPAVPSPELQANDNRPALLPDGFRALRTGLEGALEELETAQRVLRREFRS